jgi:hypothetical protein
VRNREAQQRRGEEAEVDPEQFQDPDNEYGLFAGTTYEADDEEADKIYDMVDQNMDARRRTRRYATSLFLPLPLNETVCELTCSTQGGARRNRNSKTPRRATKTPTAVRGS